MCVSVLEGGQPKCLNCYENQVWIAKKKRVENQKFDSEERGYFWVTKKRAKNKVSECLNCLSESLKPSE